MQFKHYKFLIYSDLYRITGRATFCKILKHVFFGESYKYIFWMRTCSYMKENTFLKYSLYIVARFLLKKQTYRLTISIPPDTKIGSGLYIGHFGGIFISSQSIIGNNCNISQGVTLGKANRGKNKGYPVIGNNVYIGPGAKIVGAVKIGNNVAIGANCVVTKNIQDNSVVVGIPAKIISYNGAEGYINKTDYLDKI